jgi:hypothetical protein
MRGAEVSPWRGEPDGYIVVPYEQEAMGTLDYDRFRRDRPLAFRWLGAFRAILAKRKVMAATGWKLDQNDWCQVMGTEHMTGKPCVVVREMGKRPAAAVVTQRYDNRLGRTATVLIDHKLLYCTVADEDEAHYLTAMINSEPMQDLLASFLNEVGVSPGALSRLPVPPYDEQASRALVQAAREAAIAAGRGDRPALTTAERKVNTEVRKLLGVQTSEAASVEADTTEDADAAAETFEQPELVTDTGEEDVDTAEQVDGNEAC